MNKDLSNYDRESDSSYAELYQVAHMYYDLGMLQPEIADKMFFSRSKVSRMLKRAREMGIVQITVKQFFDRVPAIEKAVCSKFGLEDAIIISSFGENNTDSFDALSEIGGEYVSGLIHGNCSMGITRGTSVFRLIQHLHKKNECDLKVVQLMGSSTAEFQSEETQNIMNDVINIFGGNAYYLNTPLYIDDLYAKNILLQDGTVRAVFNAMENCDIMLSGIGMLDSVTISRPNWHSYMTTRHIEEMHAKKAVGSMCGQYFDINGNIIPCEWNAKIMAASLDIFKEADTSIAIAAGPEKAMSMLGALRGGFMNVLMTDVVTISNILELSNRYPRQYVS